MITNNYNYAVSNQIDWIKYLLISIIYSLYISIPSVLASQGPEHQFSTGILYSKSPFMNVKVTVSIPSYYYPHFTLTLPTNVVNSVDTINTSINYSYVNREYLT